MIFYKESSFQETPIGKIPKDWEVVKLSDKKLAEIIMGQSPPSSTYNKEGEGLPFLQGKMEFGEVYPSPIVHCSQPMKIAEPNDILVSVRAPVGDANVAPYKLCIGRGLAAIRFNLNRANHWFYFYYFQKIKNFLENLGKGSTFKAITKEDLENLKVPYPSFFEQQRIAEILSTVDKAIQKTDEVVAKTERLKKGLMQTLLTRGIGHKEFKDTEIGRIPKDWGVVKINKLFDLYKGTTPSTKIKDYWKGTIPFVTPTDITKINDSNEMYLKTTENYITEKGLESKGLKLVPKDSLLFTSRATIGCLVINKTEVVINQGIISLIPKDVNIDVTFFYYFLQKLKNLFENLAGGSTYKEISMSTFSNVIVPLPPYQEQKRIAEILLTFDKKLKIERNEKAKLESIKLGLMDLLLTGKIRIKVN
jgi:type I restriction enzyme S subunit